MQIRVHIFARAFHRSNLVMTTGTSGTSHRSRVKVGMHDLVHVPFAKAALKAGSKLLTRSMMSLSFDSSEKPCSDTRTLTAAPI